MIKDYTVRLSLTLLLLSLLGCATAKLDRSATAADPGYALPPAGSGSLADVAMAITEQHGEDYSGFKVLDSSFDGLYWRLALIDSATTSLDIQTYLWYPDNSGRLILERAYQASQRGVRVRLIVDDLLMQGYDQLLANLDASPNMELRIFNPWENRGSMANRAGEMLARMERLNTRMHSKLVIADGRAAIVGGRNIGDHYFGLHPTYNFHDTDLLGIGHIALQANDMFDMYWNSQWVAPGSALSTAADLEAVPTQVQALQRQIREAPELAAFPREPVDWRGQLESLTPELRPGRSKLVYDETADDQIEQRMASSMFNFYNIAEKELLIQNAYIIPGKGAMTFLRSKVDQGVRVRIITNSLSSHDVPAVNSHYEPYRDDILRAGADLWEFRSDPAIKSTVVDVPPVVSGFTGLHSKCAVADRRYVFIGSMNMDPRSRNINTEMGVMVDSPELAEDLARVIERNMTGANAWQVRIDDAGKLTWHSDDAVLSKQPARDGMQRVMNVLMKVGPKGQF